MFIALHISLIQPTLDHVTKSHIQIAALFVAWLIAFLMLLKHYANVMTCFVKNKLLKLRKHYEIMQFVLVAA
jgi:uncharacterized membrane protein